MMSDFAPVICSSGTVLSPCGLTLMLCVLLCEASTVAADFYTVGFV